LAFLCPFVNATAGESITSSPSVSVAEEMCNTKPTIICPAFVWLKPSESSHPNRTGYPTALPGGPGCGTPIVTFTDEVFIVNDCHRTYTRTWIATDPDNSSLIDTCIQTIKQIDEVPPVIDSAPTDIVVYTNNTDPLTLQNCSTQIFYNFPSVYDNHVLISVTETATRNGVEVDLKSGDHFPQGVTTVEYVAFDFCGNFATHSFTITVFCADCHLSCPDDVIVDVNGDISPAALGTPTAFSGNMNCGTLTNTSHIDEVADLACNRKSITRIWSGTFSNMSTETFTCTQRINVQDMTALTLYNCPSDINVVDNFTNAHWPEPVAIASNNANAVTLTSNFSPGNTFPVGITTVIYTATDACGNEASCSFKVSVLTDATFEDCPDDITIMCNENGVGVVDYNLPEYTGSCSTCNDPGFIPGFVYVGSFNGSNYYCSREFHTYQEAIKLIAPHGGHLASIESEAENDYLADRIIASTALIGLTDVNREGRFEWDDGSPLNYTNWYTLQPNNYENQDFVELIKGSGLWNDIDNDSKLEFVMEIPCEFVRHVGGPLPGDALPPGNYSVTFQIADGCGLNEFCTFDITVMEGLSFVCQDDIFTEVEIGVDEVSISWDIPEAFTCCSSCQSPANCVTVTQIAGPPPGSNFFRQSKTEITYQATDACGNTAICSFNVLVDINTSKGKIADNSDAGTVIRMAGTTMQEEEEILNEEEVELQPINISISNEEAQATQYFQTKVYPNPVYDLLQVELENHEQAERILLIDQQGRILINKTQGIQANTIIDMSDLTKGMYFLQLSYENSEPQTKRVTKI